MSSREAILGALRTRLKRDADDGSGVQAVAERLSAHRQNLIPQRGQLDRAGRIDLFEDYAAGADTTVARVAAADDVPSAVADFLKRHNLPANLVRAPDADLDAIPWDNQPTLTLEARKAEEPDAVSVTAAFGGALERTVMRLSSGHAAMLEDCFPDLVADPIDRIQACHRFLKYHGHLVPHHAPTLLGRKRQEVPALKVH